MRAGYQVAAGDGRRMSQEDAGPQRVLGRYSRPADAVQMTLDLSIEEMGRFDRFYIDDTKRGKLPFWMPNWQVDGTALLTGDGAPLLNSAGVPLLISATWLCMFGRNLPVKTVAAVRTRISFEIAVMP